MMLLWGAGASDLSFHFPNLGFDCACVNAATSRSTARIDFRIVPFYPSCARWLKSTQPLRVLNQGPGDIEGKRVDPERLALWNPACTMPDSDQEVPIDPERMGSDAVGAMMDPLDCRDRNHCTE